MYEYKYRLAMNGYKINYQTPRIQEVLSRWRALLFHDHAAGIKESVFLITEVIMGEAKSKSATVFLRVFEVI